MKNLVDAASKKIGRIRSFRWWGYFIATIIGIFVFVSVIPSCSVASSSKFGTLVNKNIKDETSFVSETKSLEEIIANLPTAEEIRALPLAPHPRLLASEARFAEIKEQIKTDETMRKWYEKLKWKANFFVRDRQLPRYEVIAPGHLLPVSQRLVERVSTLALVYLIENDQIYLDKAWQELVSAAQFPDWNPDHFLDTAEMTHAFAIGYDWLYKQWNQEQKSLLSNTILQKGLQPGLNGYKQEARWTEVENNWNQVCNGGNGIGAIAILEEYPQIASQVLYEALKRLPNAMQHYAPDGAWQEGLHYWHYATSHNTLILAALNTAVATDFELSKIPGFADTGFFPVYMTNPFGLPFNFADGKYRNIEAPELFWLSKQFEQPVYAQYQLKHAAPEAMDLIWYEPSLNLAKSSKKLSPDKYFPTAQIVSMRSDWENYQGIFVGFKAGDNQASHGNLDLGTFVLDALGTRWAIELGPDSYSLPGYFDKNNQRWTYYRMRAEGQNTLVINPNECPDQNIDAKARIVRTNFQPTKAYAIADLTPAYTPDVRRLKRGIALENQRHQVLIQDEIKADSPIDVFWFMHTQANIEISEDGQSAILSQDRAKLIAKILGNGEHRFTQTDAKPLSTSPIPQDQTQNTNVKKLTIELKKVTDSQLAVLFTPLLEDQKLTPQKPKVKSLARW